MKNKSIAALAAVVVLGAALAGCAKKESSAYSITVGYAPGASSTLPVLALEQGYFADEGLVVEFVPFSNSTDGLAALQARKIDVGLSFGTSAPLTLASKGADMVIVAGNQTGGHPVLVKPEFAAEYTDITAFKGKHVGTPRLYTSDVVWRGALFRAGIVPGRDLEITEFKRPVDILEAVETGKIDVGIGATLITARAAESGIATPLFSNDLMPNHPCCRVVTTPDVIEKNRAGLKALIKGLLRAEKKFGEDPESVVAANIKHWEWTEKYARETSLEPHVKFFVDPNSNAVADMWNYMKETEYLDPSLTLDPRSLIDTSIYVDALSQLKKEYAAPFWDELTVRYKEWNE